MTDELVSVRYIVEGVSDAVDFYTRAFGFDTSAPPAFANVARGSLRLPVADPESSAGRPMPDGRKPQPGARNRIHFIIDDIDSEVARLTNAGVKFRKQIITGSGGRRILAEDTFGNPIEICQSAGQGSM